VVETDDDADDDDDDNSDVNHCCSALQIIVHLQYSVCVSLTLLSSRDCTT